MFLEDFPYFPRCKGYIDMTYAYVCQCIDNRIDNRLWSADGGRFAYALGSDRMMRRWCNGSICLPVRCLHRCGNQVILEIAALDIAIFVIGELFIESRCQPLRQAAVYLSLNYHRIDNC